MKTKLLLILLVVAAVSPLALTAEITVPNPGFEDRDINYPGDIVVGKDKYVWNARDNFWAQFECDNNGGPLRLLNMGVGVAPEGTMAVRVYTRYNDDLDAPHEGIRDFEAVCRMLDDTFDNTKTYKLTAQVLREAGREYNGYAVQLVAGGEYVPGSSRYDGYVSGGTVIAEDYNTKTIAPGGTITSTVFYTPNQDDSDLNGQPLQIRLCALEDPAFHGSTSYVIFDDVKLEGGGIVDLGPDVAAWDGLGVTMAPEFYDYGPATTYSWTTEPNAAISDPNFTVTIDDPTAETPTITVIKTGPVEVGEVKVKLSVDGGTVSDTMVIKVYDDACKAARGAGLSALNPTDINGDCNTDIGDIAMMAELWLDSTAATEAVKY